MLIALWAVAVGALILALVALIDSAASRSETRQAVKDLDGVTCRSLNHILGETDMRKEAIAEVAKVARLALEKAEAAHSRINGTGFTIQSIDLAESFSDDLRKTLKENAVKPPRKPRRLASGNDGKGLVKAPRKRPRKSGKAGKP